MLLFNKIYLLFNEKSHGRFKNYFYLMNFDKEQQEVMINNHIVQSIISEILLNDAYTLEGIALYTHTDMNIISDIYYREAIYPSPQLLYRLIELHYTLYKEIYTEVLQKII